MRSHICDGTGVRTALSVVEAETNKADEAEVQEHAIEDAHGGHRG